MLIEQRLASETARDFAFRILKNNIISMDLKPGTLVSENEIAMELGLSRTPVREAIIDLAKANIIEIRPQRGSFVSLIDTKMVEEARFLRRILDCAVIEEACKTDDAQTYSLMEENVHMQEFYLEKGNNEKLYELDNAFHKLIYVYARKDIIYEMRSTIMIHFDRVRALSMETVKNNKIVDDHKEMLEAIRNKDVKKAVLLVEKHLNRYTIDESEIESRFPEFFNINK